MQQDDFKWQFEVRDSELDLQGVVNNANYFVYMEHARNQHLKAIGMDFAALHDEGYDLVLAEAQIKFKAPLVSGDRFFVTSKIELVGRIRMKCTQEVVRASDQTVVTVGENIVVCISAATRRPCLPDKLKMALEGVVTR